jgi:hypothetical protein
MTCFDEASMTSGYARYLAAKTTVDDRALNRHVLAELRRLMPAGAPRVLEVGAGLGTMVARLMDWGVGRRRRVHPAGCGSAAAGLFSPVAARLGGRAGPAQRPAAGWAAGG